MKYLDYREKENLHKHKRDLIYKNLYECYQRILNNDNIDLIIKDHRRLINNLDIIGKYKNKFKTLTQLIVYKNSKDRIFALSCFSNYLNNLKLLH